MDQQAKSQGLTDRLPRLRSPVLVEVCKMKLMRIGSRSATLLDLSEQGFKLEFNSQFRAKPGDSYWIFIPLAPLGIIFPDEFISKVEVKWFDDERSRMGGVFANLSVENQLVVQNIVEVLLEKSGAIQSELQPDD